MNESSAIKKALLDKCLEYIDRRIETAQDSMNEAQESANEESKSSAGDKYETNREMMQMERERNAFQLSEAIKLKEKLLRISPNSEYDMAHTGSLIHTNKGNFFMAISIGQIKLDDGAYFVVSADSPIGELLNDKIAGDSFDFNGQKFKVKSIN